MIEKDVESQILRLFHAEKWPVGTIASQLGIHHSTVTRAIAQNNSPNRSRYKPHKLELFLPFIETTLENYPALTATRLCEMLVSRGYTGKVGMVRLAVAKLRGRKNPEGYLRLSTLSGEQAQVDWAHFGKIQRGKARRPLMAFVMVLSHSRAIYLHFCLSQSLANFLHGHELAFNWFGGVPRVCLYDNLKSVVIERLGQAIRFNEQFLEYASHHHFEPRPVAIARGNEKGRVERAIRYIRSSFFAARKFDGIDDLNQQALNWCNTISLDRSWQDDRTLSVREALHKERPFLLPLADNPYPCDERKSVVVGKTPYAQFDLNCYSVPHTAVRKTVVVVASLTRVRILDGDVEIATHERSYDRGQQIEDPVHVAKLQDYKSQATQHRNTNLLLQTTPSAKELLELIARKGWSMKRITKQLKTFLSLYGTIELEEAFKEAIANQSPHPNSIKLILDRNRSEQGRALPLSVPLTSDPRAQQIVVETHDLSTYNRLINFNSNRRSDSE